MDEAGVVVDLLVRPVYVVGQIDRILGLPGGTARRWIDGYRRGERPYAPVVRLESTGEDIVTWGEFVETRLLAEFRSAGVPMIHLRPTVEQLRKVFNSQYPLAHAASLLEPEGRELIWQVQEEVGLERPLRLVVRNAQLTLTQPADNFVQSADFSGHDRATVRVRPIGTFKSVWVDPLRQFGEPAVRSVPTTVIAEQYRAGERIAYIAEAYELSEEEVNDALRYELSRTANTNAA